MQKYTKDYIEQHDKLTFETYLKQVRLNEVVTSLRSSNTNNILEIGCGLHPIFLYYDDYKKMTVVEISKKFSEDAFHIAYKLNKPVHVFCGTFEDAYKKYSLLKNQKFDSIVLSNVLHILPDPIGLLLALKKVCKKGTDLHVTVPNVGSFHKTLGNEMGMFESISEHSRKFEQKRPFNTRSIKVLLESCGFKVIAKRSYLIKPFTDEQMSKIVDEDLIKGLINMETYFFNDVGCELIIKARNMENIKDNENNRISGCMGL